MTEKLEKKYIEIITKRAFSKYPTAHKVALVTEQVKSMYCLTLDVYGEWVDNALVVLKGEQKIDCYKKMLEHLCG
ncbi:hypothetical protein M0R04_06010 [Candidatus Dojkabacteria bacterium]|jgi:hypothetical protein|nr:hypothetical protein [Candidatus Dojkabacteria bacterium]